MHELSITRSLVELVVERAGTRRVCRVQVAFGALTGVDPRAIVFCYELCAQGTVLEGSRLEIRTLPARGTCECGQTVSLSALRARCDCPRAGRVTVVGGDELVVTEMELE